MVNKISDDMLRSLVERAKAQGLRVFIARQDTERAERTSGSYGYIATPDGAHVISWEAAGPGGVRFATRVRMTRETGCGWFLYFGKAEDDPEFYSLAGLDFTAALKVDRAPRWVTRRRGFVPEFLTLADVMGKMHGSHLEELGTAENDNKRGV